MTPTFRGRSVACLSKGLERRPNETVLVARRPAARRRSRLGGPQTGASSGVTECDEVAVIATRRARQLRRAP